jgi:hypothetical protein
MTSVARMRIAKRRVKPYGFLARDDLHRQSAFGLDALDVGAGDLDFFDAYRPVLRLLRMRGVQSMTNARLVSEAASSHGVTTSLEACD